MQDLLAAQQASLRRVATLVAGGAEPEDVFAAIAEEVGRVTGVPLIALWRYEPDGTAASVIGAWGEHPHPFQAGTRWSLDGPGVVAQVLQTGRPTTIENYAGVSGEIPAAARETGMRSSAAAPVIVDGVVWGAMVCASTSDEPLSDQVEDRLAEFTELVGAAIANAESRASLARLAEEQAALRRVATMVAREARAEEVFAKVTEEVANVIDSADCVLMRDEGDRTVRVVAVWGTGVSATVRVGDCVPVDGSGVVASVLADGHPHRIDDYATATGALVERGREHGIRAAAGCPIVVGGVIWGVVAVARYEARPLPPQAETRIARFADLVATAIANAEARAQVERLADEQAALRRLATLVAEGASPGAVFDTVAAEMQRLLGADGVTLGRFETDDEVEVVAHHGSAKQRVPLGIRLSHRGENVTSAVRRTGHATRIEHQASAHGPIAELARDSGVRASVGAPIVVDGRLWGVAVANWRGEQSPASDTEQRMAQFAQLLATAIANADSRDQLTASRARLLTAADEARRRVVRDLHDGAQQRLVHTLITLKLAQRSLEANDGKTASLIGEAFEHAERSNAELRELAHGILPAALTGGGLRAGVLAVVERVALPVAVDVTTERFAAEIEASAYFVIAEALTNAVKHAHAERAQVRASVADGLLHLEVRDDGIGGADPTGHGLVGMNDRVTALGGRLRIESVAGAGTLLTATVPLRRLSAQR